MMDNNRPEKNEQQQLIQSVTHLKLTLPRMSKLGIPTTPENFAVWYEYSMGSRLDLNQAIDDILNNGAIFTPEVNHDLYTQFIASDSQQELKRMQGNVRNIIDELFEQLHIMGDNMQQFRGTLDSCDNTLKGEPSLIDIKKLVSCLIEETDIVKSSSSNLESSLVTLNKQVDCLRTNAEQLDEEVTVDETTSTANRKIFDRVLSQTFQFYRLSRDSFCLLMIDIDQFKAFNDRFGNAVGDKALAYVAKFLQKCTKGTDTIARVDSNKFAVILPNTTYQNGLSTAEKIRQIVAAKQLTIGENNKTSLGNVTISIGVAEVHQDDDESSIIARSNAALAHAKRSGRDRVVGERELG